MNKIIHSENEDDLELTTHKISKPIFKDFSIILGNAAENASALQEHLMANVEKEAENIRQEAYKIGLDMGLKKAEENKCKEIAAAISTLKNICSGLEKKEEEILRNLEPQVLEMVVQISQKIIQQELSINKEILTNMLKSLLKRIKDKTEILVKVSSDDFEYIEQHQDLILQEIKDIKKINFEKSSDIKSGDLIIETKTELIDACIEKQIEELRTVLGMTQKNIREAM